MSEPFTFTNKQVTQILEENKRFQVQQQFDAERIAGLEHVIEGLREQLRSANDEIERLTNENVTLRDAAISKLLYLLEQAKTSDSKDEKKETDGT